MVQAAFSPFQKAIEAVEALSPEDQETLIDLIHRRLIERQRAEIARTRRRLCKLCGRVERKSAPLRMKPVVFRYKPVRWRLAPMITIGIKIKGIWYPIGVYVDSGAAYTVLHARIADGVGFDYRVVEPTYLQVGDGSFILVYLHNLEVQIGTERFKAKIGFSEKLGVGFNLLGRAEIFDRFKICFQESKLERRRAALIAEVTEDREAYRRGDVRRGTVDDLLAEAKAINVRKSELAAKGKRIYERIREELEREHKGRIVVIDTETGEYFLGDTLAEANRKARAKHPHKVFYAVRIGYPAVYAMKARGRK